MGAHADAGGQPGLPRINWPSRSWACSGLAQRAGPGRGCPSSAARTHNPQEDHAGRTAVGGCSRTPFAQQTPFADADVVLPVALVGRARDGFRT